MAYLFLSTYFTYLYLYIQNVFLNLKHICYTFVMFSRHFTHRMNIVCWVYLFLKPGKGS